MIRGKAQSLKAPRHSLTPFCRVSWVLLVGTDLWHRDHVTQCRLHWAPGCPVDHPNLFWDVPVRELHFSGLTRQGGWCMYVPWFPGGNISPFSTGDIMFSILRGISCSPLSRGVMFSILHRVMFFKLWSGGHRTHSVSVLLLVPCVRGSDATKASPRFRTAILEFDWCSQDVRLSFKIVKRLSEAENRTWRKSCKFPWKLNALFSCFQVSFLSRVLYSFNGVKNSHKSENNLRCVSTKETRTKQRRTLKKKREKKSTPAWQKTQELFEMNWREKANDVFAFEFFFFFCFEGWNASDYEAENGPRMTIIFHSRAHNLNLLGN